MARKEGDKNLVLVVPQEVIADAKVKAVREDVSVSAVVRAWLRKWADGEMATPEEAKEGKEGAGNQVLVGTTA